MIKVSDYIFQRLQKVYGVDCIFMITGGGAMHLNDSVKKSGLKYICNHHEQACAMAAEGYARVSKKLAAVNVTTGPGGTNTLTGILGQWTDSVPVIYIAGQVKFETTLASCPGIGLRQLGDQEINMVDIVRPITKFAAVVTDKKDVKKYLDKAVYLATAGRKGPVWLEIPMDVQGSFIEEAELNEYNLREDETHFDKEKINQQVKQLAGWLYESKRPVLVAGQGIGLAGAKKLFLDLVSKYSLPVVSTFNGFDLIPSDHPQYMGRIGTLGGRAGNFVLQNSDLMLSVGSRNNIRQVGYDWQTYARAAKKAVVDIDAAELRKPTLVPDLPICADAKVFLETLNGELSNMQLPDWAEWNSWCKKRRENYPVALPEHKSDKGGIHPYHFMRELTEVMKDGEVAVAGDGTACVVLFQAGTVKENQTIFWNSGCAAMGYDLPAAIGACIADNKASTICLAGDGSLQLNIQELETVAYHKLPIKLFYLNNGGYQSIKQTQTNYFSGNYIGCGQDSGLGFPDIIKVASAYGLKTQVLKDHRKLSEKLREILSAKEPIVCDVKLRQDYIFSPKTSSKKLSDGRMVSKPLEDMYPFLGREEFRSNMIIPIIEEE
jgi:acetolactate synthase-1/2/3 large subunit